MSRFILMKTRYSNYRIFTIIIGALFIYLLWNRVTFKEQEQKTRVCIAITVDKFTAQLKEISLLNSVKEISDYVKMNQKTMELDAITYSINRAYALKYKYPISISDLVQYKDRDFTRDRSWKRVLWVTEILYKNPQCEWLASLNSEAYFAMDHHTTDLHEWFSTTGINEATLSFDRFHREKRKRGGYYDWKDQPYWFMIAPSGINQSPPIGIPQITGAPHVDYTNHAVFFVKNNEQGKRFMEDWYFEPSDSPGEHHQIYEEFASKGTKEKRILNRLILPRHNTGVLYMSFKDFLLPWGRMIRGVFNPVERKVYLAQTINALFGIEL